VPRFAKTQDEFRALSTIKAKSDLDLFDTPVSGKKAKATKPIKRVFAIALADPEPFAFAGPGYKIRRAARSVCTGLLFF
jgi:hypothetical protein